MEKNNSIPILFPFEPTEFWSQIRVIIHEEINRNNNDSANTNLDEHLLNRKEIAKQLRISLVTLNDWVKRGLPSHKQRGRVYFIYSEVLEYIKKANLGPFKISRQLSGH